MSIVPTKNSMANAKEATLIKPRAHINLPMLTVTEAAGAIAELEQRKKDIQTELQDIDTQIAWYNEIKIAAQKLINMRKVV